MKKVNIAQIANDLGVDPRLVRQRMSRKGWSLQEALTRPKLKRRITCPEAIGTI